MYGILNHFQSLSLELFACTLRSDKVCLLTHTYMPVETPEENESSAQLSCMSIERLVVHLQYSYTFWHTPKVNVCL